MKRPLGIFAVVAVIIALTSFSSQARAQVSPTRARVAASALVVTKVDPVYPPLARQARVQGQVILKLYISKTGDTEDIQLVSGHPMLAPAAIAAVRQWKYKPYLLNGEPIAVETNVTVTFTLADKPAEGAAGDTPGSVTAGQAGSVVTPASDAPKIATPQRVRVSSGVAQGLIRSKVAPAYPADAREQHIQGVVLVKIIIDKEGNVDKIDLVSGRPELAPAAIDAVKQWKYKPYLLNGTPVEVESQVQVNFTLAY